MYPLIFKRGAIRMQKEAYDWYESQKTGLGELFLSELENKYLKLQAFPTAYSKHDSKYRHVPLKTFPYVIIFNVIKESVVVYAVFHTRRNSKTKHKGA